MKKQLPILNSAFVLIFLTLALPMETKGQIIFFIPERFGVIDITPTNFSGEAHQNAEPSLGVGISANYGKFVIHAFDDSLFLGGSNYYYTTASASSFDLPWISPNELFDYDATLDWSSAGNCYASLLPSYTSLQVRKSPDPTVSSLPFATVATATVNGSPDQPWIKVVNVTNVDHIFVGFNDLSRFPGATASVHYSLDGGTTWNTTVIDKLVPGAGQDSPAVRLAASPNGQTVYALFQRWTSSHGGDFNGAVVLMRDDGYGGSGYGALGNGTLVANNIVLPWTSSLGSQRLGSGCDVAANQVYPSQVYVAYTEMISGVPVIRVQSSANSGASFSLVYSITNATLPSLAVASGSTVGLLYLLKDGNYLEVHFLKAFSGNFSPSFINERILAKFPNNNPIQSYTPYLGDYFTLKAVNFNFFGTFSASGDPQPGDFPSGVFYQRNVSVNGTVHNNFWLTSAGTLVSLSGQNVSPSIDPFAFYDIASSLKIINIYYIPNWYYDPGDPFRGIDHFIWPELPQGEPQFQLMTSPTLGAGVAWTPASNASIIETNGQFEAAIYPTNGQAFFILEQNLSGSQFQVFAAAAKHGSLSPSGILPVPDMAILPFTATASNNFAVSHWYVDGADAQSGGSTLTLSNITTEHTLIVTFAASNDLAVTLSDIPLVPPTIPFGTNDYQINIQNEGLNFLTGITMTNPLPGTVAFISASSSQGTVNNSGGVVSANIGTLGPGASATVDITFIPLTVGSITDVVNVACSQFEPDLANNTATDVTTVINPVVITNQPASQTVPVGGTAFFSVGVSGDPPFIYQWFFNSNSIDGATASSLTLTNVSASQAGFYSVSVFQTLGGPEGPVEADSDAAALTVGSGPPTPRGSGNVQTSRPRGLR